MDTPKPGASFLESFPPDIWAYFVWYIPGDQLGRLMMTGATSLWQRLKSPNVVKSITLGEDYVMFKSLPRFLDDLPSLDELRIHSRDDDSMCTIGSIPSRVRKLRLGYFLQSDLLFGEQGSTLKLNEHLPHLQVLDLSTVKFTNFSWMTHSPQSLTSLKTYQFDGSVELPSSLIHFEAWNVALSTTSFVSKLPPSLESFVVLVSFRGLDLVIPLLPPSIRKLDFSSFPKCSGSTKNLLEQLPKSLTSLLVPTLTEIEFKVNPELTSHFPSTLQELDINPDFPCSAWPLLPPNLTKLVCRAPKKLCGVVSTIVDDHGAQHEVSSIPFGSLPRSITRLRLYLDSMYFCGPPATTTSHESYFPPHLTSLSLSNIQLSPHTTKLLPSSLTYLIIENICEHVCAHLPTGLKTLISHGTLMSPNLIKFLPKSLTYLQLLLNQPSGFCFDSSTGKRLASISKHPEYSTHKNCVDQSFDWKDSSCLPPTLTNLNLIGFDQLGDSFLLYQQLPNLLELYLDKSKHFSDLSIPLLPAHLAVLGLGSSSRISGRSFKLLPRCLLVLQLNHSESIFDYEIQHLPRTLKRVLLKKAIHLTDLCICDLPPHLKYLDMRSNTHITPSSFPRLPYPLRSSQNCATALFSAWEVNRGTVLQE